MAHRSYSKKCRCQPCRRYSLYARRAEVVCEGCGHAWDDHFYGGCAKRVGRKFCPCKVPMRDLVPLGCQHGVGMEYQCGKCEEVHRDLELRVLRRRVRELDEEVHRDLELRVLRRRVRELESKLKKESRS